MLDRIPSEIVCDAYAKTTELHPITPNECYSQNKVNYNRCFQICKKKIGKRSWDYCVFGCQMVQHFHIQMPRDECIQRNAHMAFERIASALKILHTWFECCDESSVTKQLEHIHTHSLDARYVQSSSVPFGNVRPSSISQSISVWYISRHFIFIFFFSLYFHLPIFAHRVHRMQCSATHNLSFYLIHSIILSMSVSFATPHKPFKR